MKKALIITGGYLNTKKISVCAHDYDLIIAADSGYLAAEELHISPGIVLGDFDSAPLPNTDAERIVLPCEKDDTDTMFACKLAIERGADELFILGGTGGRADHFLSNLFMMIHFAEQGVRIVLTDGENTLQILSNETVSISNRNGYFSLFPIAECTVTLRGCKYPLQNYKLPYNNPSFAVSNEVVGSHATVSIQGKAILCESIK